jgi:uncharacterized protein (TIGR02145 family)
MLFAAAVVMTAGVLGGTGWAQMKKVKPSVAVCFVGMPGTDVTQEELDRNWSRGVAATNKRIAQRNGSMQVIYNRLSQSGKYNMKGINAIDEAYGCCAGLQGASTALLAWRTDMMSYPEAANLGRYVEADYVCVVHYSEFDRTITINISMVDVEKEEEIYSNPAEMPRYGNLSDLLKKEVDLMLKEVWAFESETEIKPSSSAASKVMTFTDSRDGKTYKAVRIGRSIWMAENLNHKTGNSWCYEDNPNNCGKYGMLYDWNTANSACPPGFYLPSRGEWNDLIRTAGGDVAGTALKARTGWSRGSGTDAFGFSALPGGAHRYVNGRFYNDAGNYGYWWTGSGTMTMGHDFNNVQDNSSSPRDAGFSVRCVKDE